MYSDIEEEDNNDLEIIQEAEEVHEVHATVQSDQEGNDNENEDQEKKVVKPKRVVRNPQPKLNAETLKSARGLTAMPELFKKQKFKGKGHEEDDLRVLLKTYEYWCHRLFPKYPFEESIEKIEKLGAKRPVITLIKKIRMGLMVDEPNEPNSDEEATENNENINSQFDELITPEVVEAPQLTAEQLEIIRLNKEKALKLRQERLQRIKEQAELNLPLSNQLNFQNENNLIINETSHQTCEAEISLNTLENQLDTNRETHQSKDYEMDIDSEENNPQTQQEFPSTTNIVEISHEEFKTSSEPESLLVLTNTTSNQTINNFEEEMCVENQLDKNEDIIIQKQSAINILENIKIGVNTFLKLGSEDENICNDGDVPDKNDRDKSNKKDEDKSDNSLILLNNKESEINVEDLLNNIDKNNES